MQVFAKLHLLILRCGTISALEALRDALYKYSTTTTTTTTLHGSASTMQLR